MINLFTCDQCGRTEQTPFAAQTEDLNTAEAEKLVLDMFHAAKRYFAEHGWYTSVGYDLCPECRKAQHKEAGYIENDLAPDTMILPLGKGSR